VTFKPKGLVVTAAGAAALWAALETGAAARVDSAIDVAIWIALATLSLAAVVGMLLRRFAMFGQHAAYRELTRWFRGYLHRVKTSAVVRDHFIRDRTLQEAFDQTFWMSSAASERVAWQLRSYSALARPRSFVTPMPSSYMLAIDAQAAGERSHAR